jgi:Fe2+ transport system protein FeoA
MACLNDIRSGNNARIVFIEAGRCCHHRLAEMGLLPGERVNMLFNGGSGAVTVCVKGTKISIGAGLAEKIKVREE